MVIHKKRITLIILITFLLSAISANAIVFYSDIDERNPHSESINLLRSLGIANGYPDGTYGPNKTFTKSELTAMMCRVLKVADQSDTMRGETRFSDISSSYWATGYINLLDSLGVLNYITEDTFEPDNVTLVSDAIMMSISIVGYRDIVIAHGGTIDNYMKVANDIGLLKNITAISSDCITRGNIAQLLYNTLNTPVIKDGLPTKSLLEDRFGVYIANGYISNTYITSSTVPKGSVEFKINNLQDFFSLSSVTGRYNYKTSETDCLRPANAYLQKIGSDWVFVYIHILEDESNIASRKLTEIDRNWTTTQVVNNGYIYFDIAQIKASNAQVYINGVMLGRLNKLTDNDIEKYILNNKNGNITFMYYTSVLDAVCIYIDFYEIAIVEQVHHNTITFRDCDDSLENESLTIDVNAELSIDSNYISDPSIDKFIINDIIAIRRNVLPQVNPVNFYNILHNRYPEQIYLANETADGCYDSNGNYYPKGNLTKNMMFILTLNPNIYCEVKLYLDPFGCIAKYSTVKNYGFLSNVEKSGGILARISDATGIKTVPLAPKVKINGVVVNDNEYFNTQDEFYNVFKRRDITFSAGYLVDAVSKVIEISSDNYLYSCQIVSYGLTNTGEISELNFASAHTEYLPVVGTTFTTVDRTNNQMKGLNIGNNTQIYLCSDGGQPTSISMSSLADGAQYNIFAVGIDDDDNNSIVILKSYVEPPVYPFRVSNITIDNLADHSAVIRGVYFYKTGEYYGNLNIYVVVYKNNKIIGIRIFHNVDYENEEISQYYNLIIPYSTGDATIKVFLLNDALAPLSTCYIQDYFIQ